MRPVNTFVNYIHQIPMWNEMYFRVDVAPMYIHNVDWFYLAFTVTLIIHVVKRMYYIQSGV